MINFLEFEKKIEKNNLKNVLFFFGEEKILIDKTEKKIIQKIIPRDFQEFNLLKFLNTKVNIDDIINFFDTFPIYSKNKLIILKNTEILSHTTDKEQKKLESLISNLPNYLYLLIIEDCLCAKNNNIVNLIKNVGQIINFKKSSKKEVEAFIKIKIDCLDKKISSKDLKYFVELCNYNLLDCNNQIEKISNHADISIKKNDIDQVYTKTLTSKIFDITNYLFCSNKKKIYELLKEFQKNKEQPLSILRIILNNLRNIFMVKCLIENKTPPWKIKKFFDSNKIFLINKFIEQSKNIDKKKLFHALEEGTKLEIKIKSGKIAFPWIFINLFIVNNFLT
ncbi:MAG: DNA polymerase III subunit delta [Clostridiales bacterium]|nr:DNA polymerase III subunit delta [Clostridiales bacterium]